MKWPWLSLLLAVCTACASGAVTPGMVDAAKKRWPDASAESLEKGRATFQEKCKECHALPDPAAKTPEQWSKILIKMGKLAGLDDAGRESVERYVIAAREGG